MWPIKPIKQDTGTSHFRVEAKRDTQKCMWWVAEPRLQSDLGNEVNPDLSSIRDGETSYPGDWIPSHFTTQESSINQVVQSGTQNYSRNRFTVFTSSQVLSNCLCSTRALSEPVGGPHKATRLVDVTYLTLDFVFQ